MKTSNFLVDPSLFIGDFIPSVSCSSSILIPVCCCYCYCWKCFRSSRSVSTSQPRDRLTKIFESPPHFRSAQHLIYLSVYFYIFISLQFVSPRIFLSMPLRKEREPVSEHIGIRFKIDDWHDYRRSIVPRINTEEVLQLVVRSRLPD